MHRGGMPHLYTSPPACAVCKTEQILMSKQEICRANLVCILKLNVFSKFDKFDCEFQLSLDGWHRARLLKKTTLIERERESELKSESEKSPRCTNMCVCVQIQKQII